MSAIVGLDRIRQQPGWEHFDEAEYRRVFGSDEEQAERLRRREEDRDMLSSPCVVDEYPGEYVTVLNGEVVAHSRDWRELREQLIANGTWGRGAVTALVRAE